MTRRDQFADARDDAADVRDAVADARDRLADARDSTADARDTTSCGRELDVIRLFQRATNRDACAERRDRAADARDTDKDRRDSRPAPLHVRSPLWKRHGLPQRIAFTLVKTGTMLQVTEPTWSTSYATRRDGVMMLPPAARAALWTGLSPRATGWPPARSARRRETTVDPAAPGATRPPEVSSVLMLKAPSPLRHERRARNCADSRLRFLPELS
jgi:hypothetical protein